MNIAVVTLVIGEEFGWGAEVLFHGLASHGMPDSVSRIVLGVDQCDFAEPMPITIDYSDLPVERQTQFAHVAKKFYALTLDFDRIISIDSDMMCVGDCSYLFSDNLGELSYYATRDLAAHVHHSETMKRLLLREELMFNCGVTVYHPHLLPELHDKMLDDIRGGMLHTYDGGDQGYLNQYMQLNNIEVGWLPPEYNCCIDVYMPQVPRESMRIVHFAGEKAKPWNSNFSENDWRTPWTSLWWKQWAQIQYEKQKIKKRKDQQDASNTLGLVCD